MKLNNKGMSIVEVVLTFAIIMLITTGLLMIVVNYRNKVSVSVERLTMDTFKNNITQDVYNDTLKYGLSEINEYSSANLKNMEEDVKTELKNLYQSENGTGSYISDYDFNGYFYGIHTDSMNIDGAVDIVERDLKNYQVKDYNKSSDTDYLNIFAQALITKAKEKFGDPAAGNSCLILSDLNRCINLKLKNNTNRVFGTSKIIEDNTDSSVVRNSLENKFIYYDGIKYKIKDTIPTYIPKDKDGNQRKLSDLQRIEVTDEGILQSDFSILEDGTKVYIYRINVGIYHIDFREDFGIHLVISTTDIGSSYPATYSPYNAKPVKSTYTPEHKTKCIDRKSGLSSSCDGDCISNTCQLYNPGPGWECAYERSCNVYECSKGGTIVNGLCSYISSYTCPDGGTLNKKTKKCARYTCPEGGTFNESDLKCYY